MGIVKFWVMGEYDGDYTIYTIDKCEEHLFIEYVKANFNPHNWGYHSNIIYATERETEELLEHMREEMEQEEWNEEEDEEADPNVL